MFDPPRFQLAPESQCLKLKKQEKQALYKNLAIASELAAVVGPTSNVLTLLGPISSSLEFKVAIEY